MARRPAPKHRGLGHDAGFAVGAAGRQRHDDMCRGARGGQHFVVVVVVVAVAAAVVVYGL